jgi:hypothetical protein
VTLSDPVLLAVIAGVGGIIGLFIRDLIAQRDKANERAEKYLEGWQAALRVNERQARVAKDTKDAAKDPKP